jgi:carboxypeptidase PM20D1
MSPTSILVIIVALILFLLAFILVKTLIFARKSSSTAISFKYGVPRFAQDPQILAEHLASVIKIQTISHEDPKEDVIENFETMQTLLAKTYPLTHKNLKKELVDGHSMIFTWEGKDASLNPVVFMAHQDVVPADEYTLDQWTYPPFSGKIADGFIWGRGTMDIKCQMISVFESVEALLAAKFKPERTIILTFSHNEEVLGTGALAVVKHLQEKGVRVEAVIDEGGSIYDGIIPGVKGYVATIGISEKGYLSLKFTAHATGGHSSTPSKETAIGILTQAITRLENNRFPTDVRMVKPMFEGLGSAASPIMQMAFANLWLFGPIVAKILSAKGETDATIRTTTAPTIFHSGVKDNVLPSVAEAVVNFRILPGQSIADVCEFIRFVIKDKRVTFEPMDQKAWEASPLSPVDGDAYRHIASVIGEIWPGTAVAPFIMLGGTDSRNFCEISDCVYRFTPMVATEDDMHRVHGVNERIGIDEFHQMADTLYRIMVRCSQKDL